MLLNLSKIYSNIDVVAGPDMLAVLERVSYAVELALTAWVMFHAAHGRSRAFASPGLQDDG